MPKFDYNNGKRPFLMRPNEVSDEQIEQIAQTLENCPYSKIKGTYILGEGKIDACCAVGAALSGIIPEKRLIELYQMYGNGLLSKVYQNEPEGQNDRFLAVFNLANSLINLNEIILDNLSFPEIAQILRERYKKGM
jgi:hypothetical protein